MVDFFFSLVVLLLCWPRHRHSKATHLTNHANKIHFYRFISLFFLSSPHLHHSLNLSVFDVHVNVELYLSTTFYQPTHRLPSNIHTSNGSRMDWVTSARVQALFNVQLATFFIGFRLRISFQ